MSSSSILPPSVGAILPGRPDGGAVTLTARGAAPVLEVLVDGAMVDVVLMGRPGKATLQVMTSRGPLELKAQGGALMPPLADGANLTLTVLHAVGGPQLRLLAVNGRALPGIVLPAGGDPAMPGKALLPQAVPAAGTGTAPLKSAGAASGGGLPLGLTAVMVRPALADPAGPGGNGPGGALGMTAVGGPGAAPTLADLPPTLPAGTRMLVRVVERLPPLPEGEEWLPSPVMAGPGPGRDAGGTSGSGLALPQLAGTVIAKPPQGRAMLQTAIGTLSVPVDDSVRVGDRLRLDVVQRPTAPPPAPPPDPAPRGLGNHGWAALTETLQNLPGEALAKDAAPFLRLLPQMGPHLLTGMALFVDALQREERRRDAVGSLERALEKKGRRDLARQVGEDLEQIATDSRAGRGEGDWRLLLIPLVSQQVVEPVRLYVRGAGDGTAESGADAQRHEQRFVLDFTLSRMGRLQLDGLVRQGDKQFDLIIRTQEPLQAWMRHDLQGLFQDAADLFGTAGSIGFQAGGGWVEPGPPVHSPTQIMA